MITLQKIAEFAQKHSNKPAVVSGKSQMSWHDLHTQTSNCIAYLLARSSLGSLPYQACYIADNRLDLVPWLAAFATLSIPVVGLDYTLPLGVLQAMTESISADFVLISSKRLRLVDALPNFIYGKAPHGMIFDLDSLGISYIQAIGGSLSLGKDLVYPPARPFRSISFTSGTSGLPKAVSRSRSFDQRRFRYFVERYSFSDADRFLVGMPLYSE